MPLGAHDRANMEAVIERDWSSTWRRSMDSAPGDETLFSSLLTRNHWNHVARFAGS